MCLQLARMQSSKVLMQVGLCEGIKFQKAVIKHKSQFTSAPHGIGVKMKPKSGADICGRKHLNLPLLFASEHFSHSLKSGLLIPQEFMPPVSRNGFLLHNC